MDMGADSLLEVDSVVDSLVVEVDMEDLAVLGVVVI